MKRSRRVNAPAVKRRSKKHAAKRSAELPRSTERAAAFREMRRKVDAFAKTHPRFDELAEDIQYWLQKGLDLDDAYLVANTLYPSRRAMIEATLKRMSGEKP